MPNGSAQLGGAPVAHILIRGWSGIFVAEICERRADVEFYGPRGTDGRFQPRGAVVE